jgi:hypothetical protein
MQGIITEPACRIIMLGLWLLLTSVLAITVICEQQVLSDLKGLEFGTEWKILGPFRLGTRGDHSQ